MLHLFKRLLLHSSLGSVAPLSYVHDNYLTLCTSELDPDSIPLAEFVCYVPHPPSPLKRMRCHVFSCNRLYVYIYNLPVLTLPSQQLQVSCNPVHHALGRRADPEHRQTTGIDLRPAGISNNLGGDIQTPRLAHQLEYLVLALDLHRDLGLAALLPPPQEHGCRAARALLALSE